MNNKSEELANAHWNYIKQVLEHDGDSEGIIELIGFHYVAAFIHGYKHGVEDCQKGDKNEKKNSD